MAGNKHRIPVAPSPTPQELTKTIEAFLPQFFGGEWPKINQTQAITLMHAYVGIRGSIAKAEQNLPSWFREKVRVAFALMVLNKKAPQSSPGCQTAWYDRGKKAYSPRRQATRMLTAGWTWPEA